MIHFESVQKTYPGATQPALRELTMRIKPSELVALVGRSGSGKTTALKTVNRLVAPDAGRVLLENEPVRFLDAVRLRRRIGYVCQDLGLLPHRTVEENVALVPRLLRWDPSSVQRRVEDLLARVGLTPADDFRPRYPGGLSGGQRQRVAVARALAARPRIMLLDEPFGALDPMTRDHLQRAYRGLHESLQLTTVLVTHDMTEALMLGDRIAVMEDGALERIDTPQRLLADPGDGAAARLLETPRHHARRLAALEGQRS